MSAGRGGFGTPSTKVPENKRYAHIKSSIDTGATAKKVETISTGATARRRDEIFKRIKPATLVRYLGENEVSETVYAMGSDAGDARSTSSVVASKAEPAASRAAPTSVASISSVAGSVVSVIDSDTTVAESRDVVLLDLRDPDEFAACHLPLAQNYPAVKINRDQFSPELHRCKRDPSVLLVVYHTSDQKSAEVATLLVQKGWESVYCLTGGFEEMVQSYPEVLEGEVPDRPSTGGSRTSSTRR